MKLFPVIMAGGSGSRLWPLSRSLFPKQFLPLVSEQSMLQDTITRIKGFDCEQSIFLCNEDHRFMVAEQLREIEHTNARIILEPAARNTAPAIALAAIDVVENHGDGLLLVLAADHVINDPDEFKNSVEKAIELANKDRLVTFGIVPRSAETGYGYIKRGSTDGDNGFQVERFVEKPDLDTAEKYLQSGNYYWNSGMFLFKASQYLNALKEHSAEILSACQQAYKEKTEDLDFTRVGKDAFLSSPDDSIDYAIMEKTDKATVIPLDAGWSDVGSWSALWEINEKDEYGNANHGDVINKDTKDSFVYASSRLVATVGLKDIIIIETKDAILVADKNKVQDVKSIVNELKENKREEFRLHREVYRPWGKYDSIDTGNRYQVKRITVKPGAKLSVQMHHHRAEHWVVVSGTAKVTNGDKELLLTENQSTYIPVGVVHSLENPGKVDLELIEVQSGSYLGEDDIVRFEDKYGRA